MEIAVQVGVIAALVLALASIAGGVVLFRGSRRVGGGFDSADRRSDDVAGAKLAYLFRNDGPSSRQRR